MSIENGSDAPAFSLASDRDGALTLASAAGRKMVVYFYPKDDTPGCTTEAKDFSALADEFGAAETLVIGVSKDSLARHAKFRAKHDLTVALGSDPQGATIEAFGAWVEKSLYGRKYMGIERATFLIGRDGKVAAVWRKVKVNGHAAAVLEAAAALA